MEAAFGNDCAPVPGTGALGSVAQLSCAAGEVRALGLSLTPFHHEGELQAFVVVVSDLSGTKKAERALEEQKALIFAAAKMSALGEMSSGVAHEINNPVSIIEGRVRVLLRVLGTPGAQPDLQEMTTQLESIGHTARRIARIVKTMRSFTHDESGEPLARHSTRGIFDDTMSLCRERFQSAGVDLVIEGDLEVDVSCRPAEIVQVLMNLLGNAFDAVQGVQVPCLRMRVASTPDRATIVVEDNGPGIAPELEDRLFRPFFTTKAVGSGTGLGLSISLRIMERHSGSIAYSRVDGWTRFVVDLPRLV